MAKIFVRTRIHTSAWTTKNGHWRALYSSALQLGGVDPIPECNAQYAYAHYQADEAAQMREYLNGQIELTERIRADLDRSPASAAKAKKLTQRIRNKLSEWPACFTLDSEEEDEDRLKAQIESQLVALDGVLSRGRGHLDKSAAYLAIGLVLDILRAEHDRVGAYPVNCWWRFE
ncbi:hypothetical protein GOB18_07845 [Sinorhizobium meliloti]|nr:hypothetical protein [Sinorhizobium meliloti]MDW9453677.1 hypothetical protein [Sinorhizobium meliloti]